MATMTNCANCGKTFNEATGTYTGEGLVCGDCADTDMDLAADDAAMANQGNLPLGFCAGFFGGCIGLILVMSIAKGEETKKGAKIGFGAQLVIGGILRVMAN
jgi:hypothetical protein